jgi:hypothetical protein
MPMHLKHTSTISWLEYTNNYYNQQNNGFFLQQLVPMSQPRTRMNEENKNEKTMNDDNE